MKPPPLPLTETLPSLLAVATTQISVPVAVSLVVASWLTFAWQDSLPEQSLWPLLLVSAWLMLVLLALGGLAAGGTVCWRARKFAGACAVCVVLNSLILGAIAAALLWGFLSGK